MALVRVANVIINNPAHAVDKGFYYLFEGAVCPGDWVQVPFGKGDKLLDGVVLSIEETEKTNRLKTIAQVVEPLLNEEQLALLHWIRKNYICTYYDALRLLLPPGKSYRGMGGKTVQGVLLSIDRLEAEALLAQLQVKAPAQARVLEIVMQTDCIAVTDLTEFACTTRGTVKALTDKGVLAFCDIRIERNPLCGKAVLPSAALSLTEEQQKVLNFATECMENQRHKTILLRGVTGSGKTEVYLQCVEQALKRGKQAIILVPEISLTPQMTERFTSRFGDRVAILHSRLSSGERFDAWEKIKNGQVDLVVGARSAVFAPFLNLGLIVADEEHESSYKSEMNPKYDAREVAEFRMRRSNGLLILASATPGIDSAYKAVRGTYTLMQMKQRYNGVSLPKADIVDMRFELAKGNKSFLSFDLQDAIAENIRKGEQSILFMNRRGFSSFVSCRKCGFAAKCPECDIALTYHKFEEQLVCHYCGYTVSNFSFCPKCGSNSIRHFGIGTQRVEEELKKQFPGISVLRMDADTTRGKMSHQAILRKFKEEKTNVLVGTQMITKGLDFPSVSLVGVLAADMMLYVDDYKATEKTFQLITQVCGRAGRGDKQGRAIIQTYSPTHWVIECARQQDFKAFYKQEIALRRKLYYPPFCDVVHFVVSGDQADAVQTQIRNIVKNVYDRFVQNGIKSTILGPTPSPIPKIENRYRWHALVKCSVTDIVREILRESVQVDPKSACVVSLDINTNNML